ncbi:MAG: ATP-binding protein [Candidatus Gastranaerophilales bacterium]|nr:ATP-binding protein [Candidatus Gastranaerophilales bacterium]
MQQIKITRDTDLIYLDSFRVADNMIQLKAIEMFNNGHTVQQIEEFCKKSALKKNAEELKKEANLSKRFATRTFESFKIDNETQKYAYKRAKEYCENIDKNLENGTGLIFAGNGCVGTGKTHLACAIANYLLEKGYPVKVINVTKMIYQIKENFKVDEYINVPILLIDDIGKETGTQWVCETLYFIFNERYEGMKSTILTTENGIEEIRKNYITQINGKTIDRGKSMVSRLTEDFIYIPLTGEDYRQRRMTA